MAPEKPKRQIAIVKGLVTRDDNKILLVRRKREWHAAAHNKWEMPGGKIDFGETPEEATIREIKEESGYHALITRLLPKIISARWEYEDRVSQQLLICYVCKLVGGVASTTDHGVSEVAWFTPQEALLLESLPGTHEFIEEYLKQ